MQTIQPHMIENYHKDWVPATIMLGQDLRLTVAEQTHYANSWRAKNSKAPPRDERTRQTIIHVYKDVPYHALIDEEKKQATVFVPRKGWFETAVIPLEYVVHRSGRDEETVNYREWGMNRTSETHVEVV